MHFLPNTLEEDAVGERYWPDGFKQVIREEVSPALRSEFNEQSLGPIYEAKFSDKFPGKYPDLKSFIDQVIGLVVIGAENGTDQGFDGIFESFMNESPLPEAKPYARHLWPYIFSVPLKEKIHQAIVKEYRKDKSLQYAYQVGYAAKYRSFAEFVDEIAWIVVAGMESGVDDMLAKIYKSFLANRALPQGRRNPKRLKDW
jgi:hypothetical protein